MDTIIEISADEWRQVLHGVVPFTGDDERTPSGHLLLRGDGTRRSWVGTDGFQLAVLDAGPWTPQVRVALPLRTVKAALELFAADEDPTLVVHTDDEDPADVRLSVRSARADLSFPAGPAGFEDLDAILTAPLDQPYIDVRVPRRVLHGVVAVARDAPNGVDLDDPDTRLPLFWLETTPEQLLVRVDWDELGAATYAVTAAADGHTQMPVNPRYLAGFLTALDDLGADEDIVVELPANRRGPLMLRSGSWLGYLMPIDTTPESHRRRLETELMQLLGVDELVRDEDGDYPIALERGRLYVRLSTEEPARVQVFSIVLRDVASTHELLVELNSLNAGVGFARVFWVNDQVLAEVELLAETLDLEELANACATVARVSDELGPLLAASFGADAPTDPADGTRDAPDADDRRGDSDPAEPR